MVAATEAFYNSRATGLALYDPSTGEGDLTDQWLTARADFLAARLQLNSEDSSVVVGPTSDFINYHDAGSNVDVNVVPIWSRLGQNPTGSSQLYDYWFGAVVDETHDGGGGIDHMFGGDGIDVLRGLAGADYLEGGSGDDTLQGGDDRDTLIGMQDDDILEGGAGADRLEGGLGFDRYRIVEGQAGDTIRDIDGLGQITLISTDGNTLTGLTGGDLVNGTAGGVQVYSSADKRFEYLLKPQADGTQTLTILHGTDHIVVENFHNGDLGIQLNDDPPPVPPNTINGTAQDDIDLVGSQGDENIYGFAGNDNLHGNNGFDVIRGGIGNDYLEGGYLGGPDTTGDRIYGEEDDDVLIGAPRGSTDDGGDVLDGGAGRDFVRRQSGMDVLDGGTGDDALSGGSGVDVLEGGDGADILVGDFDVRADATRTWTVAPQYTSDGWAIDLQFTNTFDSPGSSDDGADALHGGNGNDILFGNRGDATLHGGADDDQLIGGRGRHHVEVREGVPRLFGTGLVLAATARSDGGRESSELT